MKQNIIKIPFQELLENDSNELKKEKYSKNAGVILPHVLAYIGNHKIIKNDSGRNDAILTATAMVKGTNLILDECPWDDKSTKMPYHNPDWVKGLLLYIRTAPRGTILPHTVKATAEHLRPYGALVPLFLAAFKKYQNIEYSTWDNISRIVDSDLYEAMTCNAPIFDLETLLECRKVGSTYKTGKNIGQVKNSISVTALNPTGNTEFDELPRLAKIMLTQVWLAHPSCRNQYMVLDPNNWDVIPKPLVDTEVVKDIKKLPWDN